LRTFCRQERFFRCERFGTEKLGFFEIYDVSARTKGEGVEPVNHVLN